MPNQPPDYLIDRPTAATTEDSGTLYRVTVSDAPILDPDALNPATDEEIYLAFGAQTAYKTDPGLRSAPTASPKGEGREAFWRVHDKRTLKVVTWVAQCVSTVPIAPHTDTGSDNEVLIDEVVSPAIPVSLLDGKQVWMLVGQYTYRLQKAPSPGDRLMAGTNPFSRRVSAENTLDPSLFSRYLIGPVASVSGFSGGALNY